MSTASLIDINGAGERDAAQKATLLLIAVALNAVELAIPRLPFFPWLKPGFANIITVLWIVKYGFRDAMLFTALRVWIAGFYFGFSLFTFSLSVTGGLLSTAAMSALWTPLGKRGLAGSVGMAAVGALFHNAGQLAVVYFMMSGNMSVLGQVPFMLGASVVFGGIVGMLAPTVAEIVDSGGDGDNSITKSNIPNSNAYANTGVNADTGKIDQPIPSTTIDKLIVASTFAVSISLMFVDYLRVLIAAAIIFSLIPLTLTPKKPGVVFYPLRFYALFAFVAVTYLFFSHGTRVNSVPFVTREGLSAFVNQSLRLWCWLQTVHIFKKFNFDAIFMNALRGFFPNQQDTLKAGMIALKHFPEIVRVSKSNKKITVAATLCRPKSVLTEYVTDVSRRIASLIAADRFPPVDRTE